MAENGELTLDELCVELGERGVNVHRSTIGRMLHRLGLSQKTPTGKRAASSRNRTSTRSLDEPKKAVL
jgi:transposase